MFDLEGIADQQAVSTFCLFPQTSLSRHVKPFLRRSQALPFQHCHLAHLLLPHLLYPLFPFPSFTSSLFNQACMHPPCRHFHPHYTLPQPEPGQAGRLPGWGPRWCSGESASSGSLSLQDGSTALLWPIWPRPVLAPVCDYGPAGGQQSWHSKPCQYTAD